VFLFFVGVEVIAPRKKVAFWIFGIVGLHLREQEHQKLSLKVVANLTVEPKTLKTWS
jgi:hypothetical protein